MAEDGNDQTLDLGSFVPESFKGEDGSYDTTKFRAQFDELSSFKSQEDERRAALPKEASAYAWALPEGHAFPEGFDVEAMKTKANELNFKFVGHNPLWKDIIAISGKTDTPRVEFFSFCDAMVARDLLDLSLEFAVFLPCRVAVVQDANKKIWLLTLDWDARWLDTSKNPNQMSAKLRDGAIKIREAIDKIMRAGASGDF